MRKYVIAALILLLIPTVVFAAWPTNSTRTKDWGNETLTDSDLEGQYDILHTYFQDSLNASSGHKHDATTNEGPKIAVLASTVAGTIDFSGDTTHNSVTSDGAIVAGGNVSISGNLSVDGALPIGVSRQVVYTQTGAVADGTTVMPFDDSIPQNDEGDEYMTLAITPTDANNILKIDVVFNFEADNIGVGAALFQDTTAGALAVAAAETSASNEVGNISFTYFMTAGTASSTTFKLRAGPSGATAVTMNGVTTSRIFGGVYASSITITEIEA